MKTAIVYDRVNKWGGAEQVLLALHEIYPDAHLYTSVYNKNTAEWADVFPEIHTSLLQRIPSARTNHELFAPLMPIAFESFDFNGYDLVISVTSEAAKGIITKPDTLHVCYCLTPTRYLWSGYDDYFKGTTFKVVAKPVVNYLRKWDKIAAQRPDHMIAISVAVQERIKIYYARNSDIIYPPVDISKFQITNNKSQTNSKLQTTNKQNKKDKTDSIASLQNDEQKEYYLIVSRLVSYKKVDLAIKAFSELGKKLIVVGSGREEKYLKNIAARNIEFKGFVTDKELIDLYQNAKAFIYPQEEDFGITAVEAQSSGLPVIAFRKGGALDTVEEGMSGVFFAEQNSNSLVDAVKRFEKMEFSNDYISKRAEMFSKVNFKYDIKSYISGLLESS